MTCPFMLLCHVLLDNAVFERLFFAVEGVLHAAKHCCPLFSMWATCTWLSTLFYLHLILGASINYARLAYQHSSNLSLVFPVWAVGKCSMNKDFMLCHAFSHPMWKDAILKETCFYKGNLFNCNFDPNVDGNYSKTRHKPGWAHMLLKCFCCMCQIIQLTYICWQ